MRAPDAVRTLARDLDLIFGPRLRALVVHGRADNGAAVQALALVEALTPHDLRACADRVAQWHEDGLGTPLVIPAHEFSRSLDAFPLEFGAIIADHVVVAGDDPFTGLTVDPRHLRQACEVQARSHLLHLREGFIESGGRADHVASLIVESAPALAALVRSVARLHGVLAADAPAAARDLERDAGLGHGALERVVRLVAADVLAGDEARQLFPQYLESVERLVQAIDRWSA
jgi:hypothetical protein